MEMTMPKKVIGTILVLALLAIAGCSSNPPEGVIQTSAIKSMYVMVGDEIVKDIQKGGCSIHIFKILNDYTKTVNNEEVHIYEVDLQVKDNGSNKLLGRGQATFGLTKRGNSWYIVK
jgi:uncharacterized protein YcfL